MNLNVDDLLPFCDKCHATGEMDNPNLHANDGSGTRIISESVGCDKCDGHGVVITEGANALIKFFKRAKSKKLLDL
jgi:DnaJ-class molecular chaperone